VQVPLRRVNPAYLIGTSVTVDISKVNVSKVDDAFFKAAKKGKDKKSEAGFFKEEDKNEVWSVPPVEL
jgi:large subunit ribosomal protein L6e